MVIVIMGPAGAGKSTVGSLLSTRVGWRYVDADDFHSASSIAKMARGEPLNDHDRAPWLTALHHVVDRSLDRREPLVLACSALTEHYRLRLGEQRRGVRFVYLKTPSDLLRQRLIARGGHFAHVNLLESQLATLEEPGEPAVTVDGAADLDAIVGRIRLAFGI